jgi:hypothetical protein
VSANAAVAADGGPSLARTFLSKHGYIQTPFPSSYAFTKVPRAEIELSKLLIRNSI